MLTQDFAISSIPIIPEDLGASVGIYVLTQVRAQMLLDASDSLGFSIVVADEAQGVSDGSRGVILQSVLERLKARGTSNLLFASPQLANPELFSEMLDLPRLTWIKETESPVAQNLVFLNVDSLLRKQVEVSAQLGDRVTAIGSRELDLELLDDDQMLSVLSWEFGRGQKNLIYAGGKAACEKIASQVADLAHNATAESSSDPEDELVELSRFIKEHVHPEFLLAETVLNQVGFHYGTIPTVVRKSIEGYFDRGLLRFLVCTSTLLQGVNLPAKNLFMLKPTKGRDWTTGKAIPINAVEFYNLSGRAGRLGKEFEGNVFLINIRNWESSPLTGPRLQTVRGSLKQSAVDETSQLVEFMLDEDHPSGRSDSYEASFMKLYNDARSGEIDSSAITIY
jgi:replicative superfamily II helicase